MFAPGLLSKKKILVTGGGSGLGKSLALRLSELGAELVICGRRAQVVEEAARNISATTGGVVTAFSCDVRDADAIEKMMDSIWQSGPLDILINNAAGNFIARTETLSPRAVDSVLNIVLHGSLYCTIAAGKRWIAAERSGTVMSIVTTAAFHGLAYTVPSAAAKAGVLAMTKSLAVEWGPKGIRLIALAPGLFPTSGAWERLYPAGAVPEPQELAVPLRRVGEHAELANMVSFMVSDQASYMNGDCIVLDGGRWLQGVGGTGTRTLSSLTDDQWTAFRAK